MTALETRTVAGITSDPDNNVLIDSLLARGLVRHIDVWTDEEAESARLAAFWPSCEDSCEYSMHPGAGFVRRRERQGGESYWPWSHRGRAGDELDVSCRSTLERVVGAFDAPDFALGVSISPQLVAVLARGRRLSPRFRVRGPRGGRGPVLSWDKLLPSLRRDGYLPAEASP